MKTQEIKQGDQLTTQPMLAGLFTDLASTKQAYHLLNEKGYPFDDIHMIMSDETYNKKFAHLSDDSELTLNIKQAAGTGSVIGGGLGALTGVVAALSTSFIIPGLGILIAGPIAAGLAGASTGAIAGGLIGSLIGADIPEEHARFFESGIHKGQILLGVYPRNPEDASFFENTWNEKKPEENY